ncbi:hypothetical protein D3C87_1840110 [compost metagenome]
MGFAGELLLEGRLFLALEVEVILLIADVKAVPQRQHQDHQQGTRRCLDHRRPGTHVVGIQVVDIDLAQAFEPFGQPHLALSTAG